MLKIDDHISSFLTKNKILVTISRLNMKILFQIIKYNGIHVFGFIHKTIFYGT